MDKWAVNGIGNWCVESFPCLMDQYFYEEQI